MQAEYCFEHHMFYNDTKIPMPGIYCVFTAMLEENPKLIYISQSADINKAILKHRNQSLWKIKARKWTKLSEGSDYPLLYTSCRIDDLNIGKLLLQNLSMRFNLQCRTLTPRNIGSKTKKVKINCSYSIMDCILDI